MVLTETFIQLSQPLTQWLVSKTLMPLFLSELDQEAQEWRELIFSKLMLKSFKLRALLLIKLLKRP